MGLLYFYTVQVENGNSIFTNLIEDTAFEAVISEIVSNC